MDSSEKRSLTYINKIPVFNRVIASLTVNQLLSEEDKTYILTCAILFLKHYAKDQRHTSYAEFAYYIILKYGVTYDDYTPLYDFSANFGFYPIVRSILENQLIDQHSLNDCFLNIEVERFQNENYIETIHQYKGKNNLLADEGSELSYIAPTSFGKSSVIIDCIRKYEKIGINKIGVIVPTKSLLMQTYRMIRNAELGKKILIHDEMFSGEDAFIAVFTQERALRLLSKNQVNFDLLFIDEAHNLLKDDSRSVLLGRLLTRNRFLNPMQRVIYLSPLLDDVNALKIAEGQQINGHKIPFTIKEPEIFEFRLNKEVYKYNRFVNSHYKIGIEHNLFQYIVNNTKKKNFLYNFRPVSIEKLAKQLAAYISAPIQSPAITELVKILRQEVHDKFYAVDYITYGIVYLHGKLPDLIKEYLESKFRDLPEVKYIIANSVILEGMNLPIDNLFIMNVRGLYEKELTNLIGRVNRLNSIFTTDANNLAKLLPPVHFLNSEEYNRKDSNMTSRLELLRSRTFKDIIENPTLENFDFDDLSIPADQKESKRNQFKQIKEDEEFLNKQPVDHRERLKQYLIETGIATFYSNLDSVIVLLLERMSNIKDWSDWNSLNMLTKINELFILGQEHLKDYEFLRLGTAEARNYYEFHITVSQRRALKQNIIYQFDYFKKRVEDNDPIFYFGETYGERARNPSANPPEAKTYIDLGLKNDVELVNLAIVKLKMEDDFVSFKLNKFIIMLYDYECITRDEYNFYIYGTTDQNKIELTKIGLSVSLITRLEDDGQLQYLYFDQYNNLKSMPEFNQYKSAANDFYRFEIERFLN